VTIEIPAVWSRTGQRWESPDGRFYFDEEEADRACDFFPTFLTHHIGEFADRAFELLDYQRLLIVRPIFGWKRAKDGTRRFRFLFAFIPKGNGKSPLASGLGLFLTLCDGEAAAEVYAVAGDKDQAKVVHDSAKVMVEQSADLAELCQVLKDSIYHPTSRSFYKAIAADAGGAHGVRPHGVMFDELHNQPSRDLFEALRKSLLKRRQPLFLMFSHAGDDDESICFEEYEHAKLVLKGTSKDESYLPVVFELEEKGDWTNEEALARVNPGYGVTINPEILASECRAAQEEPRKLNDFLRFNANRWTGSAVAWLPIEWWDACMDTAFTDQDLVELPCAAGLDMAQKIDLVAFVVVFRQQLQGEHPMAVEVSDQDQAGKEQKREVSLNYRVFIRPFFWLPEETVKEREREGFDSYRQWERSKLLTVTEGATIDYDRVYQDITQRILPRFPLLKQGQVGFDPAFATDIANRLRDKAGLTTAEVLQNYTNMNEPGHVFEALVKARRVRHDGHRLMRWNVENVAVKRDDAGRIRPVKPRKRTKKIDGVVGALMGLQRLMAVPDKKPSVYNHRGMRVFDI
jgi:phage terminase large subunit-like protein